MGFVDALGHLLNLLAPAWAVPAIAAGLAKLLWRRELAGVAWRALFAYACAGALPMLLGGLLVFGRDGKMATYLAMVGAVALTLWWRGFGPGRR
jgi:hypothetical protein